MPRRSNKTMRQRQQQDDNDDEHPKSMTFGVALYKFQQTWKISSLERRKTKRQEAFGLDYLPLAAAKAKNQKEAKSIFRTAMKDIQAINQEIQQCHWNIQERVSNGSKHSANTEAQKQQHQTNSRSVPSPNNPTLVSQSHNNIEIPPSDRDIRFDKHNNNNNNNNNSHRSEGSPTNGRARGGRGRSGARSRGRGRGRGRGRDALNASNRSDASGSGRGGGRGRGRGGDRGGRGRGRAGRGRGRKNNSPPRRRGEQPVSPPTSPSRLAKQVEHRQDFQLRHSPEGKKARLSLVNLALVPDNFQTNRTEKWHKSSFQVQTYHTKGGWSQTTIGLVEKIQGKSIQRGIAKFEAHPQLFIGMMYLQEMFNWPVEEQEYTLIYRDGTTGLQPKGIAKQGPVTFLLHAYQPLPCLPKNNTLLKKYKDGFTDTMTYRGKKLTTKKLPAWLPGRGMGLLDDPSLQLLPSTNPNKVDPSDIAQGSVGDCWLLSGIAALAEYQGSIAKLFSATPDLLERPYPDGRPNLYTVTLYDLHTWQPVEVTVDERLAARSHNKGGALFGAKATLNGELWVAYLEKAIAKHCGGWDAIDGGQCTHAWSLLTGCREQYILQRNPDRKSHFGIWAKFNPDTQQWAEHANSPHEGPLGLWRSDGPDIGSGGLKDLSEDDVMERLCLWNETNYLLGCSSPGESDQQSTNGVVDNHAYSIIDCRRNVAGTGISMVRVRNPWGYGTIENSLFGRGGKGWNQYPAIRKALKYQEFEQDDGVFWVTQAEFFEHYETIYLGAMDMHKFLGITSPPPSPNPRSSPLGQLATQTPSMASPRKPIVPSLPLAPTMDESENTSDAEPETESSSNAAAVALTTKDALVDTGSMNSTSSSEENLDEELEGRNSSDADDASSEDSRNSEEEDEQKSAAAAAAADDLKSTSVDEERSRNEAASVDTIMLESEDSSEEDEDEEELKSSSSSDEETNTNDRLSTGEAASVDTIMLESEDSSEGDEDEDELKSSSSSHEETKNDRRSTGETASVDTIMESEDDSSSSASSQEEDQEDLKSSLSSDEETDTNDRRGTGETASVDTIMLETDSDDDDDESAGSSEAESSENEEEDASSSGSSSSSSGDDDDDSDSS